MPPFASFWQGLDIKDWAKLGLLAKEGIRKERGNRRSVIKDLSAFLQRKGWLGKADADALSALKACLSFLADSPARIVLVNLEDLWLETQPQNIPSTQEQYPNWRRKARYSLDELCHMPQVLGTIHIINSLRRQGRHQ